MRGDINIGDIYLILVTISPWIDACLGVIEVILVICIVEKYNHHTVCVWNKTIIILFAYEIIQSSYCLCM